MRYFAYGSNLCRERIVGRAPSAAFVSVARLFAYGLRFHKRGRDGTGKCSVVRAPSEEVIGVVFEISDADRRALDREEGVPTHYETIEIRVVAATGSIEAYTYVAAPARIDERLRPTAAYKELVVRGARQHGFPAEYLARLEAIEVVAPIPGEARS